MRYKPDPDEDEQLRQDVTTAVADVYEQLLEPACGPEDAIGLLEEAIAAARRWSSAR